MDSPPLPGTYAARATYFADRVCPFCDHHNPAAAKFCNDCASPLYLKACNQCDAITHQAATKCYKCGAEYPSLSPQQGTTSGFSAADRIAAKATLDAGAAATVTEPLSADSALLVGWRLSRVDRFLLAAIATILIAGGYAAYCINGSRSDAVGLGSQPIAAGEHNEPKPASTVSAAVESKPVQAETTAALEPAIPKTEPEPSARASARQRPVPVAAVKRSSPHQRLAAAIQAPVGATPPLARSPAPSSAGASVEETRKGRQANPGEAMQVSLARCGGDLIARIACDQRVRRHFCEGRWGEAPECASVVNDRGQ